MHEAVTKSSTATKSYFPTTSEDLLAPITLTNRSQTTDTLGWSHDLANPDCEVKLENWNLSMSKDTTSRRRAQSAGLQKIAFPSTMPSLTESNSSTADISVVASDHTMGGNRWRFNGNGQLVDSEWELADEIVRLKIGEDAREDVHGQIQTPPKSKLAAAAVAQFSESSPLETSSDASVDSSPHASDHQINISHSRGSSTDTTISSSQESALSAASNTMLAPSHPLPTVGAVSEVKERPHSFSGGLSSADLRRLQHAGDGPGTDTDRQVQQPASGQNISLNDKHFPPEQLSYPSLATNSATLHRPQPQLHPQLYDYRSGPTQAPLPQVPNRDDLQLDYNIQQRNFNPVLQGTSLATAGPGAPTFVPGRPNNAVPGLPYRPLPRGFPQQGLLPSPTTLGYAGGHHTSHLSLGNTQQLYDMMLPGPPHESHHPAVTRVQQQHNVFRGTHQHSASDPSAIRDPATLALLNNNMQAFTNGMFPPNIAPPLQPLYPGQFYGTQDAYPGPDVATAQVMAARLQSQYTGPYGVLPPQGMGMDGGLPSPSSGSGQNGPSANNRKLGLYKTELCRSWEEKGTCRYATKCQFAHGEDELRKVARHPKYKTEICRTFWVSGSCPYGKRCCFIHTELPTSGATATTGAASATDGGPPSSHPDGRTRSLSTNSDPNEASISLLARISAKRNQEPGNNGSPVDMNPTNGFQFSRPPTGSLRVDTALEGPSLKQNKSAYPSFASNGILLPTSDHTSTKSPAPVTAGPDLGRHNNSRTEIVGYNHQTRVNKVATPSNSNVRHSFNGTEVDVNFTPVSGHSSFALSSGESNPSAGHVPRVQGHVRAGSAGNWGSFSRSNLAPSPYPHSSSPGGDITINSPWSTTELAVGSSRLHEKAWA